MYTNTHYARFITLRGGARNRRKSEGINVGSLINCPPNFSAMASPAVARAPQAAYRRSVPRKNKSGNAGQGRATESGIRMMAG
jgi:hypothetical protein